jgi:hypothetical protein
MYARLLSPLGLFHEFFLFDFIFCAEPYGSLPNGNNLGQPHRPAFSTSSLHPFPQASVLSFAIGTQLKFGEVLPTTMNPFILCIKLLIVENCHCHHRNSIV